jgi:hypothetical protein
MTLLEAIKRSLRDRGFSDQEIENHIALTSNAMSAENRKWIAESIVPDGREEDFIKRLQEPKFLAAAFAINRDTAKQN